jgi:hypothetical protein
MCSHNGVTAMTGPKTEKSGQEAGKDDEAQAARERELRDMIDRVEAEKSGRARPSNESPHDFVERQMRDKLKK